MNEQETAERESDKQYLRELSRETRTCSAWKLFALGGNGTAVVSCGLPVDHDQYGDESIMYHFTSTRHEDGSAVIFKWPL